MRRALQDLAADHPLSSAPERVPGARRRLEADLDRYLEHGAETVADLEPRYWKAEQMMGISGKAGNLRGQKIDGGNIGLPVTLDANGRAAFTTTNVPAGEHVIEAVYTSDNANIKSSSGALSGAVTVTAAPTMTRRRSRRSESQPSGQAIRNPPTVPLAMNAAIPAVSSPRRCAKIGPKVKNALAVTPQRKAATSPKGDCRYSPLRLIRAPPP